VTPAEARVLRAVEAAARLGAPDMRAAVLRLWRTLRQALSDAEIERLVRSGAVEELVRTLVTIAEADATTAPVREAIRETYRRAAEAGIRSLPLPTARTIGVAFDFLNPTIVEAIRTLESKALGTLTTEVAETVRVVVRQGIEAGVGPRALVPTLRKSIGLAPSQAQEVANFRAALESGDFAKARGYQLRDKRFDATLKRLAKEKGSLTPAQVETMTARYRERRIAWNAETQSRTAMLDASRAGQRASWESTIANGDLDRRRVRKRWVTTKDGRQRPEHDAMHGVEVAFDKTFPVDGGVMVPGENAYNCRCVALYRYAPARAQG
jgi:hypothetical protein